MGVRDVGPRVGVRDVGLRISVRDVSLHLGVCGVGLRVAGVGFGLVYLLGRTGDRGVVVGLDCLVFGLLDDHFVGGVCGHVGRHLGRFGGLVRVGVRVDHRPGGRGSVGAGRGRVLGVGRVTRVDARLGGRRFRTRCRLVAVVCLVCPLHRGLGLGRRRLSRVTLDGDATVGAVRALVRVTVQPEERLHFVEESH